VPPVILLPAVDIRGGRCVRLIQGDYDREIEYDDDPVDVAKRFEAEGAEWLHVVDLDAALEGVPRNREIVAQVIRNVDVPVQCSGGIRADDDLEWAASAGARRVVLGTRALLEPSFVDDAVEQYGDLVAVGLDVRGTRLQARGWTEEAGELWPMLDRLEAAGAGRFVVTDVERDGMMKGPNVDLLREVVARTSRKVIASGGISTLDDLRGIGGVGVEGVIVGRALYAGAFRLPEALATLAGAN
jgi:phosphoribosylanthranilate isomerase